MTEMPARHAMQIWLVATPAAAWLGLALSGLGDARDPRNLWALVPLIATSLGLGTALRAAWSRGFLWVLLCATLTTAIPAGVTLAALVAAEGLQTTGAGVPALGLIRALLGAALLGAFWSVPILLVHPLSAIAWVIGVWATARAARATAPVRARA